ncbi:18179_t:CDS:2 [Funneliformis geosporum]|uniref:12591_t:CDS:1 n=1 Tax=Funneliformis geosporum TaxID=1117311 RepID=A0A9W4SFG0_9GLOM|nr:12591_t:CDS:2 [Funneliformis geosporum]CAI2168838.1 18179_t:CDS:2 [Funneliformis geosporum]
MSTKNYDEHVVTKSRRGRKAFAAFAVREEHIDITGKLIIWRLEDIFDDPFDPFEMQSQKLK